GEIALPDGAEVLDDPERTAISVVLPAKPVETEDTGATEVSEQSAETAKE
ncbi:MAG: hypothetical protein RLZZ499_2463, partial [Cyanobacteriota bacterium]